MAWIHWPRQNKLVPTRLVAGLLLRRDFIEDAALTKLGLMGGGAPGDLDRDPFYLWTCFGRA
jgi:hypothetical protein